MSFLSGRRRPADLSYVSVQRYYGLFRLYAARIYEDEYETLRHRPCEYEKYFYLKRSKRHRREAVFDARNFLTFDYEGYLYHCHADDAAQQDRAVRDYFESAILTHKGVSTENFPLYLKEIEFTFNHSVPMQKTLLERYYFRSA